VAHQIRSGVLVAHVHDKNTPFLFGLSLMTSLASRLNDLPVAHAQQLMMYIFIGILTAQLTLPSDDDYRLLLQDIFQRAAVPIPAPLPQQQLPSSAPHDSDGNSAILITLITSTLLPPE